MDLLQFLFLMLFTASYSCIHVAKSSPHNNLSDLESLQAFRAHVSDPLAILSANWTTNTSFCSWMGVTCSRRHQRVASLVLPNTPLNGTISPYLANLSFLSVLDLGNTTLTGSIPNALSQLPRLRELVLQMNYLSGSIPSNLFNMSSLAGIYLSGNNLSSSLPWDHNISTTHCRLETVYIGYNQLTGNLPSPLAWCRNLRRLSFLSNKLSGTLPVELGYSQELTLLDLSDNRFIGKIPSSLGNLTKLRTLSISRNNLHGEIPKELGYLSNLDTLLLYSNNMTGPIPTELLNASMITLIELSGNHLTGSVPATLGNAMPLLNRLNLANNSLTGSVDFLTSLSSCRNLEYIAVSLNELEGSLPSSVGNLSSNLKQFIIPGNRVKGSIPPGFANYSGLLLLNLGNNELSGPIPSELTRLGSLQKLNLRYNRINGTIPSELGLMKSLNILNFEANQLHGDIPDSIGNITGLQLLLLDANKLSSKIPMSLWSLRGLIELTLSQNALTGSIPPQVSNLVALDLLDLSKNKLSGNISTALGELKMLAHLDLSRNSFDGQIPSSLGQLINVEYLNLSGNFLSGVIPKSLADLRYLDSLDLSFNLLEGEIPKGGVFSHLNISSLEGNAGLCGLPRLSFHPCTANIISSRSRRKLHLLAYVLPVISLAVIACMFLVFIIYRRRKARSTASIDAPNLGDYRLVSYHELVRATNNFSQANLLGAGSFGSVFRAHLDDGSIIAVKVLNLEVEGALKSFDTELQALCRVRHRNLIKIISVCLSMDFKALILQYMPNGSLEQWLHSEGRHLNLLQRLNIMLDVASALEYLHHHHPQVILHCDLKPSNVLLDEEMVAHVSDFGVARLLIGDSKTIASASAPGTIGYIAPEYGATCKVSKMGDVYSFGILLLETFTGKKPTDVDDGESSLREWVRAALPTSLLDVIDANLFKDDSVSEQQLEPSNSTHHCLSSVFELGLQCSSYAPNERIQMIYVVPRLQKIKGEYLSQSRLL